MAKKPSTSIDALYGLEPVIDTERSAGCDALERFVQIACPYCGESYGVLIDLSAGSQSYVQDCEVCCQPITLNLLVDQNNEFVSLKTERLD